MQDSLPDMSFLRQAQDRSERPKELVLSPALSKVEGGVEGSEESRSQIAICPCDNGILRASLRMTPFEGAWQQNVG